MPEKDVTASDTSVEIDLGADFGGAVGVQRAGGSGGTTAVQVSFDEVNWVNCMIRDLATGDLAANLAADGGGFVDCPGARKARINHVHGSGTTRITLTMSSR